MPEPFQPEDDDGLPDHPPDEAWWERGFHRNQKLMDRYFAVLGDNPDFSRFKRPEDLYNKVRFGTDPPERADDDEEIDEALAELAESEAGYPGQPGETPIVSLEDSRGSNDPENTLLEGQGDGEGYSDVARMARDFAVQLHHHRDRDRLPGILVVSARRIGANLAGGHGLGYDEETLCGNIVKCRWALADCEFCCELLEQRASHSNDAGDNALASQGRLLSRAIRDRISRLRCRVWW
jgi:hypothetical protein